MEHEPGRSLSNAKIAGKFQATNSVFAICNGPNGDEPLVQAKGESSKIVPTLALN
jgi:hypothetical protein